MSNLTQAKQDLIEVINNASKSSEYNKLDLEIIFGSVNIIINNMLYIAALRNITELELWHLESIIMRNRLMINIINKFCEIE